MAPCSSHARGVIVCLTLKASLVSQRPNAGRDVGSSLSDQISAQIRVIPVDDLGAERLEAISF